MINSKQYFLAMDNGCMTLTAKKSSPVVFSVPHDGMYHNDYYGWFETRKSGFKGRDMRTWPLVNHILHNFTANAVRALMPRAYIDYNRLPDNNGCFPIGIPFEDASLAPLYCHYHSTIDKFVEQSIENFGVHNVLLLDFHGFGNQPSYAPPEGYDAIFGTRNRKNIKHGAIDIAMADFLNSKGYAIFLPSESTFVKDREDFYDANMGVTSSFYSEKWNINSIQIEMTRKFRIDDPKSGEQFAKHVATFLMNYHR